MKGVIGLVVLTLMVSAASADLSVTCKGATPSDIVNALLGSGVTVSNVQFAGTECSAGTFDGGTEIIGVEDGIILSSGNINNVIGPNTQDGITEILNLPGDTSLNSLIPGYTTNDATILEFDFVPTSDVLTFDYVFASDEYNEFVNSQFNDVFGFFLNGMDISNNIALIPGTTTPVSINNVNGGNPYGTDPSNQVYYINNDPNDPGPAAINTEMDGLTTVLKATAHVIKGETNHIKLAIADAGDQVLDSNVFISNFQSPQLTLAPLSATNYLGKDHTLTATLVDPAGNPIADVTVSFGITGANTYSGTATTNPSGIATWSYKGTNEGMDTIVATATVNEEELTSNQVTKTWEKPPYVQVSIDIKPGSCPNPLNMADKGVLPASILGTDEFNVYNIDPSTIKLGLADTIDEKYVSPIRHNFEDVATPYEGEEDCGCHELKADGKMDLTLKFNVQDLVGILKDEGVAGTFPLTIMGNLKGDVGGTSITGSDCIVLKSTKETARPTSNVPKRPTSNVLKKP
jgi:hypothetical protein